jgi:spore maturation protein CgeB
MKVVILNDNDTYPCGALYFFNGFTRAGSQPRIENLFYRPIRGEGDRNPMRARPSREYSFKREKALRKVRLWRWERSNELYRLVLPRIAAYAPQMLLLTSRMWNLNAEFIAEVRARVPGCLIFWVTQDPLVADAHAYAVLPLLDCFCTYARHDIPVAYLCGARRVARLPFAWDDTLYGPRQLSGAEKSFYASDVAFVGTWQPHIEQWVKPLTAYECKIWGHQWYYRCDDRALMRCWQGEVFGLNEDMAAVISGSKIVLSIVRTQNGSTHCGRTFEIPGCGGFMLANRTDEQLEFFPEDECAVYFSTQQELKDKLAYYCAHEESRLRIARAGNAAAQAHTYTERAKTLLALAKELR